MRKTIIIIVITLALISGGVIYVLHGLRQHAENDRWYAADPSDIPYFLNILTETKDNQVKLRVTKVLAKTAIVAEYSGADVFKPEELQIIHDELLSLVRENTDEFITSESIFCLASFRFDDPETIAFVSRYATDPRINGVVARYLSMVKPPPDVAMGILETALKYADTGSVCECFGAASEYGPEAHELLPIILRRIGDCHNYRLLSDIFAIILTIEGVELPTEAGVDSQGNLRTLEQTQYFRVFEVLLDDSPVYALVFTEAYIHHTSWVNIEDTVRDSLKLAGKTDKIMARLKKSLKSEDPEIVQSAQELLNLIEG